MGVKLLVDLRPAPAVVEAVVHSQGQTAEFVGVPVVPRTGPTVIAWVT